ncbi:hypothetical protein LY76DRAFT_331293 [Colletotrichum caudatum]|nr:hypothetical protein LY76DRAFT_331293 [Colletotrichum caudatum]
MVLNDQGGRPGLSTWMDVMVVSEKGGSGRGRQHATGPPAGRGESWVLLDGDATTAAFNEESHPTVARFCSREDGQGGEPKEGEDDDIVTPAVWGFVRFPTLSLIFSRQNTTAYVCLSGLDMEAHVSGRERVRKSKKAHSERAKRCCIFFLFCCLFSFFLFAFRE